MPPRQVYEQQEEYGKFATLKNWLEFPCCARKQDVISSEARGVLGEE
jgi:hypothetical protein